MRTEYRIEPHGAEFILIEDSRGMVGIYSTSEAAEADLVRCLKKDGMSDTAQCLVNVAIKAFMKIHGVDRETAERWIRDVIDGA